MMTTKKETKEPDKPDEFESNERKFNLYALWTIIGGVVFMFTPILFTSHKLTDFLNDYFFTIDFTKTGNIGDTIGGITAPFIALIAAVLIYLSFRQQMVANRMQWKMYKDTQKQIQDGKDDKRDDFMLSVLNAHYDNILRKIESFKYLGDNIGIFEIIGVYATITNSEDDYDVVEVMVLNNLISIHFDIAFFLNYLKDINSATYREMYLSRYYTQIHNILFTNSVMDDFLALEEIPTGYEVLNKATKMIHKYYEQADELEF